MRIAALTFRPSLRFVLLCLLLAALLVPAVSLAQGAVLSEADIDRIAHAVVLIGAIEDDELVSSGSGTIVTSTGLIYTNYHVIEGADDLLIAVLDDINERPIPRYFARVVEEYPEVDFAVLQIDRRYSSGRTIDPEELELPYLEASGDVSVTRGERVYVFGYPGIGDGYLVLTEGAITTIQNGTVSGERIPVWYQTDAEISPGNSGGLVTNADGEFIGIPTAVRTEERTLGRLGGILPIGALLAARQDDQRTEADVDRALNISITRIEHDVIIEGRSEPGMQIFTQISANGYAGEYLRAGIFFFWEDGEQISGENAVASDRTRDNKLTVQTVLEARNDNAEWRDLWFWLPYSSFPYFTEAQRDGFIVAALGMDGDDFAVTSDEFGFTIAAPGEPVSADQFQIEIVSIEHNVRIEGRAETGMRIYTNIAVSGQRDREVRVALFFFWGNGDPISGENAVPTDRTSDGSLTVQVVLVPESDQQVWRNYWFWIPYSNFPVGRRGAQEAYVEAGIGLNSGRFISSSNRIEFILNYPD